MRHKPVDVTKFTIEIRHRFSGHLVKSCYGTFEYSVAFHFDECATRLSRFVADRNSTAYLQQVLVLSIGMYVRRQNTGLLARLKNDATGTVTEQHSRATVFPVRDARQRLTTDHQRRLCAASLNVPVGHIQSVDKAAASGINIKRRRALDAQFVLNNAGRRRKHFVGGACPDNDKINILRPHSGVSHSSLRRFQPDRGCGFPVYDQVPAFDPGTLPDPLIRCIHRFLEVFIRHDLCRQETAYAGNTCVCHDFSFMNAAISLSVG